MEISKSDCLFTPTGNRKTMNGGAWIECSAICRGLNHLCACLGKSKCVDRWHKVDENQELLPLSESNHSLKLKVNNYIAS